MNKATAIVATILAGAAASVFTWAVLGDLTEPGIEDPDYLVRGPDVSGATRAGLGIGSLIVLLAALAVIWRIHRAGVTTGRDLSALVPVAGVGLFVGLGARVVTAGGIGANIGAGLMVMAAPVIVPTLVFIAIMLWRVPRPMVAPGPPAPPPPPPSSPAPPAPPAPPPPSSPAPSSE